ncbi:MAG: carboxypeptidase regulatory-like domain-containing protein [Planctomycetales bacterium]|nr:carboxypeptidase regulatory-like domain-containing protein [Planctomycetales bacterium]
MRTFLVVLVVAGCTASVVAAAPGAQQIALKSGAVIVGAVSMDGADLVIDVDGASLRVPLNDVALVTPADEQGSGQVDRLLLKALESRQQYGGGREIGVIAEAFRLAPDDPRVAYWYALSLAEAGYGKGADDVFAPRREAIAEVYPGMADRLAQLIEAKKKIEALPPKLGKRLDQIERAADASTYFEDGDLQAAYFQLVDQHDQPVPRDAFRISCNGNNEKTETFADGYVLFTFVRRSSYDDQPCRVEMQKEGYADAQFEFRGARGGARDAGKFVAKSYGDSDRSEAQALVVDESGKPLAGASVSVSTNRGNAATDPQTANDQGVVTFALFPGDYSFRASLPGYNTAYQSLAVRHAGDAAQPVKLVMYPQLLGTARVEWRMQPAGYPGPRMPEGDGEAELTAPPNVQASRGPYGPGLPWLRFQQQADELQLEVVQQMQYPGAPPNFVGRYRAAEADEESPKPAEQFEAIDLSDVDALKDQLDLVPVDPRRGGASTVLPAQEGAIYVGRVVSRDMQTGRPAVYDFKVIVSDVDQSTE